MRRQEFAELDSGRRLAETTNQLPLVVDDTDARAQIGDVPAERGRRTDLADIKDRLVPVWHAQPARTMQILPLRLELAVAVEHLNAVVLAVGDMDPAVGATADVVHDGDFTFAGAGFAHYSKIFPAGGYLWTRELPYPSET